MLTNPPATWSDERKHEYFDWAKAVVEQVRGANPKLAERFDAVWEVGGVVCGIRGDSMA
jgi:guanosine-3',5'-bis(diphosphate) 3'-pyrophosphohydrolase